MTTTDTTTDKQEEVAIEETTATGEGDTTEKANEDAEDDEDDEDDEDSDDDVQITIGDIKTQSTTYELVISKSQEIKCKSF